MKELDIETQLFDHLSNLLRSLVDYSEQQQRYSFLYVNEWEGLKVVGGDENMKLKGYGASSLQTLKVLGFIDLTVDEQSNRKSATTSLHLLPAAYEPARYENNGRFGKWWARFIHRMYRGFVVVFSLIAFVLSLISTLKDVLLG